MARGKDACLASLARLEVQLAEARDMRPHLAEVQEELIERYGQRVDRVGLKDANTDEAEIALLLGKLYKAVIKCIGQLIEWNSEELGRCG